MKPQIAVMLAVLLAGSAALGVERAPEPKSRPYVEVAFVLDTTGSMSGLIAAAKAKIWSIANQIVLGEPKPIVRMALVPYRDKGDAYVTKVFDLTDNIDQVYADLMKFQAAGGGDGPENVNQALHDAVHKLQWSDDPGTLRIIYLVGDYPPHNEYTDVPTYDKTAKLAIEKGIYINTVLCGGNAATRRIWVEIADRAEGTFVAIDQDGGVKDIDTPYDKELAGLNAELTSTVVAFGDKAVRRKNAALNAAASRYAMKAQADRAIYNVHAGIGASGDLLDAVRDQRVDLEEIEKDQLPKNMQEMSADRRKEYITALQARRDGINARIRALVVKRAAYLREHAAELGPDGFDRKIIETLSRQAARKHIRYTLAETPTPDTPDK